MQEKSENLFFGGLLLKALIVSDTHGKTENLERVLLLEKPIDMLFHLGDVCGDDDMIEYLAGCTTAMISGNCDLFSRLPRTKAVKLGNLAIHMEHGNRLPYERELIRREARDLGVNVMMFGHTHVPLLEEKDGIWLVNPGSLTHPRQSSGRPTYIVLNMDDEGKVEFTLKEL